MKMNLFTTPLYCIALLLITGTICRAADATVNPEPSVVPAVQQWQASTGILELGGKPHIQVDAHDQTALDPMARELQKELTTIGFPDSMIDDASRPGLGRIRSIILTIDQSNPIPTRLVNEAYRITIDNNVKISATTPTGIFYGTRTLLQMLQHNPSGQLPKGTITDFPIFNRRMVMIDVGRKPFPFPVLKDFLRILAWYKINELHLHLSDEAFGGNYTGFRVQCDTFPGLTSKDCFYTKQQLRELQDMAHQMGITITPEIDMPGHARVFTNYWPDLKLSGSYLDVSNPQTTERLKKLLDEMIPIFDAPDFHIGTDEYSVGGSKERREKLHEAFRVFINTMNAYIRSKGKNCRIWNGYEGMSGTTQIDPTVIVDMWFSDDPLGHIAQGHHIINSGQGRTYIVPGGHYYGVNNSGVYNNWDPSRFSGNAAQDPKPENPNLLGGKLHIWNDQGPSGYTLTEIADLALPSFQAFSEKFWGHKASAKYSDFQKRAAHTLPIPGVAIFQRDNAKDADGLVFQFDGEKTLTDANSTIPLPWANNPTPNLEYMNPPAIPSRADLEYPWTLSMKIKRTADLKTRGVIMSSDLVEICANHSKDKKVGVGILRAAGIFGKDPRSSAVSHDTDAVVSDPLPLNQWVDLTIVALPRQTQFYINGSFVGQDNNQMVCPLKHLGSNTGNSFVGSIKDLKIWNVARSARQIGRAAGLQIPENIAVGCPATASQSDSGNGFTADLMVDDDAGTRWSSGPTQSDGWVAVDLRKPHQFSAVRLNFEHAYARNVTIEASDDGTTWHNVGSGETHEGINTIPCTPTTARHVRILLKHPGNAWGYSIWELEVLGT